MSAALKELLETSATESALTLEKISRKHAIQQAKRYLSSCKKAPGFGARYTMEEFLKLQGVRKDLIPEVSSVVKGVFDGIA